VGLPEERLGEVVRLASPEIEAAHSFSPFHSFDPLDGSARVCS
jgi:hypothetical protein